MGQIGKKQKDDFKLKHTNTFIKCKCSKYSNWKTEIDTLDMYSKIYFNAQKSLTFR